MSSLYTVVLAGGSGTRFWPVSRRRHPKQLLRLGKAQQTLLELTFERVKSLHASPFMVVGQEHAQACKEAVPFAKTLIEPIGRNTAAAIALAALHIQDGIMIVLPADHFIHDTQLFCAHLKQACTYAEQGRIALIGVTPTYPETGYGYIEQGEMLAEDVYQVKRFCEKPDKQKALSFLQSQQFVWNAGIFVMQASAYLQKLKQFLPEMFALLQPLREVINTPAYDDMLKTVYPKLQNISIDFGIMEHVQDAVMVKTSCGWSDVGSWNALESLVESDAHNTLSIGKVLSHENTNCVFYAEQGGMVAAHGLTDIVVVHTHDATLVLPKDKVQEVRALYQMLVEKNWHEYL